MKQLQEDICKINILIFMQTSSLSFVVSLTITFWI